MALFHYILKCDKKASTKRVFGKFFIWLLYRQNPKKERPSPKNMLSEMNALNHYVLKLQRVDDDTDNDYRESQHFKL